MDYVQLGRTGARVSRIALGTAFRGQWDDKACEDVVRRALDLGINFIDTANVYGEDRVGHAEQIIGRVAKGRRNELVIATKIYHPVGTGPNDWGIGRIQLLREIDNCLKRLGTDHVDVLYLHERDSSCPLETSLSAADAAVRHGKVRHVGLSRYPSWQGAQALALADRRGFEPVAVLQNRYNLIYREAELGILPFVRDTGLALTICSPLAIGLLSGAFKSSSPPRPNTPWAKGYRGFDSLMTAQTDAVVEQLRQIGREMAKTPAQVALAWLLSHPEVTSVIAGPDTIEQLEENAGGCFTLSREQCSALDKLSAPEWARRP